MEAKLKALKVVDLKAILSKANVSVTSKATKADLVSKILASTTAVQAYNTLYPSEPTSTNDDLLALPEELDWTVDEVSSSKVEEHASQKTEPPADSAPNSSSAPPPTLVKDSTATAEPPASTTNSSSEDPELEKRRKRAERFGIPLVEPKSQKVPTTQSTKDTDKLKARAERFGLKLGAGAANGKAESGKQGPGSKRKRDAPPVTQVDPEEVERRQKRAERFGLKAT
ncbi:hypothetical protein GYMLUDRAFT_37135 [Collybiopsis luxurians FD-317 M1]|nr:hypothetical protein GYMLUDRAFT_37135 [Collybiopsis luxurians FD-317 M1]